MEPTSRSIHSRRQLGEVVAAAGNPSNATFTFVSHKRSSLISRMETVSIAVTGAFAGAGFIGAFSGLAALVGVLGVAAAASLATPIGWAALGCLAMGVLLLLCRHVLIRKAGFNPQTLDSLAGNIAYGTVAAALGIFCYVRSALFDEMPEVSPSYKRFMDWVDDFRFGYAFGALGRSSPVIEPTSAPRIYYVYKGDRFVHYHNGNIKIKLPKQQD